MKTRTLVLIAAAALAAPARANPYLFDLDLVDGSGNPLPGFSFVIDSTPTVSSYSASGLAYFRIDGVTLLADPADPAPRASPVDLLFFDQNGGGAFSTADFTTISYFGTQVFTGAVSAPSFTLGTTDLYGALDGTTGTLRISNRIAAAPEPAAWAMMIGGFGIAGGVLRRRARLGTA